MIAVVMGPPREPLPAPTGAASSASLLTLREAARLTGLRRRALRERVRRGQVAVRVIAKGRTTKLRLTPDALAAAGLLPNGAPSRPDSPSAGTDPDLPAALLDLIREQNARITTLEEQRFQLAGQLGAALERAHALEERVLALTAPASPSSAIDPAPFDGAEDDVRLGPLIPPERGPRPRRNGVVAATPTRRSKPAASTPRGSRPPRAGSVEAGPDLADSVPMGSRSRWPRRALATLRRGATLAAARRGTTDSTDPRHPPSGA